MAIAPGIEQIRRELVERGWSHQALADRIQHWAYRNGEGTLGITRSYVSEWLTGKRGISAPYAHRLEGVLGIPADQFIDRRSARARELNDMKRRDFLRVAASAAAASTLGSLPAGLQDGLGTLWGAEHAWRGTQVGSIADRGVDWNLLLPGGQSFDGSVVMTQLHAITSSTQDHAAIEIGDAARLTAFLRVPHRGMILAAQEAEEGSRFLLLDARQARRQLLRRPSRRPVLTIPRAFELDDLTFGILWALANLDDALAADDLALAEEIRGLSAYERLTSSAVSREAVGDLTTVSQMWLGSNFCAHHILSSLDGFRDLPVFWTREQRGEEASTWLLFAHKYDYLRATSQRFAGSAEGLMRAFCVPEDAVRTSPRFERMVLLLAVALMESLGIEARVCVEPEYANVDGFVLAPGQAVVANWVRAEGVWHVDNTSRRTLLHDFGEAAGHARERSVIDAPTAAGRLAAFARYLELDLDWLRRRCRDLSEYGCDWLAAPRNHLMSTAGLDEACRYVGQLPAETA